MLANYLLEKLTQKGAGEEGMKNKRLIFHSLVHSPNDFATSNKQAWARLKPGAQTLI